ncbi:MAG: S-layer homology domain-containing protein [Armatimonadetes bacterium]|nr:S-layer homology domain-containing protein [Armatimonadota bacterium]
MRKYSWLATLIIIFSLISQVMSAPLFGDVPENHWARDAVAQLAAKGLIVGYPDGTFKGDRAATRWELAMVVARMLAKSEQMWATFATKADLEALRQLVNNLREELDALGVRVNNLEDNLSKLTARVWDLEKIRFYGSVNSIFVTQGFKSTGLPDPLGFDSGSAFNTANAIGSAVGALMRPPGMADFTNATATLANAVYNSFPVMDYFTGTPFVNGTAFTTVAILGTKLRVSSDVNGGAEFAAYSRVGDAAVAPYYGVSAPYLSNSFTQHFTLDGTNRRFPYTKMTLDNAWFKYNPSGTKVTLGSIRSDSFDDLVLYGEPNPNAVQGWGQPLPFFGVAVNGSTYLIAPMKFEVLGSKLANDVPNSTIAAANMYNSFLTGFNLDWEFKGGDFKLNFLRAADDYFGGTLLASGGMQNPFAWQNPLNGWSAAQVPQQGQRPIQAGNSANGLLGPQGVSIWGASIRYEFPNNIKFAAEYASSAYKPNLNSGFEKTGNAGRAELNTSVFNNLLFLSAEYVAVSPFFDPYVIPYPNVISGESTYRTTNAAGFAFMNQIPEPIWRMDFTYIPGYYQLHNSSMYPNNRRGLRFYANYKLPSGHGNIDAKYASLEQVAYSAPMASGGMADYPGFIEPFFWPMGGQENTKGKVEMYHLGFNYKFPNTKLGMNLAYDLGRMKRPTSLINNNAAPTNNINIAGNWGMIGLVYPFNDKFTLKGGYNLAGFKGSYRSTGINWDYKQTIPYLGFNYNISENTTWGLMLQAYKVNDSVPSSSLTNNQWDWGGTRVFSEVKISF